jgi:hypothetical protein
VRTHFPYLTNFITMESTPHARTERKPECPGRD